MRFDLASHACRIIDTHSKDGFVDTRLLWTTLPKHVQRWITTPDCLEFVLVDVMGFTSRSDTPAPAPAPEYSI